MKMCCGGVQRSAGWEPIVIIFILVELEAKHFLPQRKKK